MRLQRTVLLNSPKHHELDDLIAGETRKMHPVDPRPQGRMGNHGDTTICLPMTRDKMASQTGTGGGCMQTHSSARRLRNNLPLVADA